MVGHPVILRGLSLPGIDHDPGVPTTLSIVEQDFLPWFLSRLATPAGQQQLGSRDAYAKQNPDGQPRLFQPVHRSYNIVALEVTCQVEGLPRLDPRKIIGAGVTFRRRVLGNDAEPDVYKEYGSGLYGWMRQNDQVLGWRQIFAATDAPDAPDVAPEFREKARQGRNGRILKHAGFLQTEDDSWSEAYSPLFPASDALCRKLGKTILFGYLPVTSDERSEADGAPAAPFTSDDIAARLPSIFWPAARMAARDVADRPAAPPTNTYVLTNTVADPLPDVATLMAALNYLSQEAGLFLESGDDPAAALRYLLRARLVTLYGQNTAISFYDFLLQANTALVERRPGIIQQAMPITWPVFSDAQQVAIVNAILAAVSARWAELSPGETRYQNLNARYEIQGFARIDRSDCGCPPETIWTAPSPVLELVPWYEGGEAPPTIVELPSPSALLGKIKPNVAFKVPEEIQKFMSGLKLDKLMDGEQPADKPGWGMICGFSIPIITICAFIVLQIFLSLFHILFWWLPFIRICIPFPKK